MFFLMARKSIMMSNTIYSFDKRKQLTRGNVIMSESALFCLKWLKTNQFGDRSFSVLLVRSLNPDLCPVTPFGNFLCKLLPLSKNTPAFCIIKSKKLVSLTTSVFQKSLKWLIEKLIWITICILHIVLEDLEPVWLSEPEFLQS